MNIARRYKFWRYPLGCKIYYGIQSYLNKGHLSIKYWINANTYLWDYKIKPYNWGDYINLVLAELISGKKALPYQFVSSNTTVSMVGSILPWAIDQNTIIWGSGCLNSHDLLWKKVSKPQKVLAVRGPLTRNVLLKHGIECPEVYGDPALLFPCYYNPVIEKKYQYGIILHVSTSLSDSIKAKLKSIYGDNILFINPKKFCRWQSFIDNILSCNNIISSSLHGIIIADAYNVPNVWVCVTHSEHPDNNFKFKDYFLSIGKNIEIPIEVFNRCDVDNRLQTFTSPSIDLDKLLKTCPLI